MWSDKTTGAVNGYENAQAAASHYRAGFDEEAFRGMMRAYGFLDAELGKENDFVAASRSAFMTPYLIGAPKSVGEQLTSLLEEAHLDGAMLIFPTTWPAYRFSPRGPCPKCVPILPRPRRRKPTSDPLIPLPPSRSPILVPWWIRRGPLWSSSISKRISPRPREPWGG